MQLFGAKVELAPSMKTVSASFIVEWTKLVRKFFNLLSLNLMFLRDYLLAYIDKHFYFFKRCVKEVHFLAGAPR